MLAEDIRTPAEFSRMGRKEKLAYLAGIEQFLSRHPGVSYTNRGTVPEPYRSMLDLTGAARNDEDPYVRQRGWQTFNALLDHLPDKPKR